MLKTECGFTSRMKSTRMQEDPMESYQVIILAAGQGKRMKANFNKQFITIGSEPLLAHTIAVLNKMIGVTRSIWLISQVIEK